MYDLLFLLLLWVPYPFRILIITMAILTLFAARWNSSIDANRNLSLRFFNQEWRLLPGLLFASSFYCRIGFNRRYLLSLVTSSRYTSLRVLIVKILFVCFCIRLSISSIVMYSVYEIHISNALTLSVISLFIVQAPAQ